MANKRLLISLAHPDDESFGLGGLISRYVAEGIEVYLICATNGDVGTIDPVMLNGYNSISELRLAELECASAKLGFTEVFKFGYRDSGMPGTATTEHPESLWYTHQHDPDQVIQRVVEVMREVKPQVVITFNRYGGYGHPDHIAIQRATEQAFHLAGQQDYSVNGSQPYQPQKLYFTSVAKSRTRYRIMHTLLKGGNPRKVGKNNDIDLIKILENAEPVHARVEIFKYLEAWQEASACHISQGGGGRRDNLPVWLRQRIGFYQGFTRVVPVPSQHRVDEDDLFAGVTLEEMMMDYA